MEKLFENNEFLKGVRRFLCVPAFCRRCLCGVGVVVSMVFIWGMWKFRKKEEMRGELFHE